MSSEQRLRQVEDQLAIQRVLVEYSARIDARDFEGYADLFAREGTWQNGTTVRKGREEIIAMLVGSVIGVAMGQLPALNRALDPWLIVLLNLPALVIIILAYVWFGLNEAAAIGAVALNKIPNVIVTLREGARALDPGLDEMARAYRMPPMVKLTNVTLPQLGPVLLMVGILTLSGYFQLFAEPYVITQGGPLQSTVSVLYLMYDEGFKWWNLGNASAVAFLLFALMTVATSGLLWFARRKGAE